MTPAALRAHREAIGWTGHELARRLGCNPAYVGQLEHGRRPIPTSIAVWIAALAELHARHPAPAWRHRTAA